MERYMLVFHLRRVDFRSWYLVISLLVLLLSAVPEASAHGRDVRPLLNQADANASCIYQNELWGYRLKHPGTWQPQVTLQNVPGHPPYVIAERVSFRNEQGVIIAVEVWRNPFAYDVASWVRIYQKWALCGAGETVECTATVLKLPSICAVNLGSPQAYGEFRCLFAYEERVFRIRYVNSDNGNSEATYRAFIKGFEVASQASISTPVQ